VCRKTFGTHVLGGDERSQSHHMPAEPLTQGTRSRQNRSANGGWQSPAVARYTSQLSSLDFLLALLATACGWLSHTDLTLGRVTEGWLRWCCCMRLKLPVPLAPRPASFSLPTLEIVAPRPVYSYSAYWNRDHDFCIRPQLSSAARCSSAISETLPHHH